MRTFGIEIWDDEGKLTTFYTIRKPHQADTETDKFFLKFENDAKYRADAQALVTFILQSIGDELGAREEFFRHEGAAVGLPPPPSIVRRLALDLGEFSLRLYCLRITKNLVILMGGGIKSSQSAQDSPDLKKPFAEANTFAKAIDRALKEGDLRIHPSGRSFVCDHDQIEIEF
jgi:hypothetical protein